MKKKRHVKKKRKEEPSIFGENIPDWDDDFGLPPLDEEEIKNSPLFAKGEEEEEEEEVLDNRARLRERIRDLKSQRTRRVNDGTPKPKMAKNSTGKRGDPMSAINPKNLRMKFGEFDLNDPEEVIRILTKDPDKLSVFLRDCGIPKDIIADSLSKVLREQMENGILDSEQFINGTELLDRLQKYKK